MTLLTPQSLVSCTSGIALIGVGFVFRAVLWCAPVRHVVTLAGEDIHIFKHNGIDAHRSQPGTAIVPAIATAQANTATPFDVHFSPLLANKPKVITAFDFFRLRVGVQYSQALPFGFPFFVCAINRTLLSVIGRKSLDIHSRKPKTFCISEIKKIFCTDHLLSVSRALHGKESRHGY